MAELTSLLRPTNKLFLQRALIFMFFALILSLFPSQAPEFITNQTILSKIWELIHLLFIGIVISYGLFGRRNPDKDLGLKSDNPNSYTSPGLDEEEEEEAKIQQNWSKQFDISQPATVIDKPLFLPVRSLNPQTEEESNKDRIESSTVLPSPIPWRSRSGRVESDAPKLKSLNSSLSLSLSRESSEKKKTLYKEITSLPPASPPLPSRETSEKKKTLYKEITSLPPAPPPPPPPFLSHAPLSDRKAKATVRSFKDELKDMSMRSKSRPRTSTSSPPPMAAKSVRTFRPKEAQIEPPKRAFVESREENIVERVLISSDSDEVSDSPDSEVEEEEIEEYSDKEMIEKPKFESEKKKEASEEDKNEVDKKADEFIAKFREQIRLQRIESIKRSAGERAVRTHKKNAQPQPQPQPGPGVEIH